MSQLQRLFVWASALLQGRLARVSMLVLLVLSAGIVQTAQADTLQITAGNNQSARVGTLLPTALTVRLLTPLGLPRIGVTVTFAITSGGGTLSRTTNITNLLGNASASFTLPNTAGTVTVSASAPAATSVTFTETALVGPAARIVLTPTPSTGTVGVAKTYTATVQDLLGNRVTTSTASIAFTRTGATGTFSATPVTAVAGIATTNFTPTAAGTATITASTLGLSNGTASLTVSPPPPTRVDIAPTTANTTRSGTLTFTATLRDANSAVTTTATNAVTFTASGVAGTFTPSGTVTPVNGVATVTFAPSATGSGSVAASATGLTGSSSTVTVAPDPATQLTLTPANASVVSGSAITYSATLRDATGAIATSATNAVTFVATGVTGSFVPSTVTPVNGVATATFTPSSAGAATVSVSSSGLTGASTGLTVTAANGNPQSLFTTQVPVGDNLTDGVPYELGMKFRVTTPGQITAIRFWKSSNETAVHVGRIWSSTGTLLASVTFNAETASGWQEQALSAPLNVQANTTYTVSVNIGLYYPFTLSGLATQITNGNIQSVADGNNGVYGTSGSFPTFSYQSSNYFRDVVFVPNAGGPGAATQLSITPASASVAAGEAITYSATVLDAQGATVTSATNPVTFASSVVSGTFAPAATVTPVNGVATATFTPSASGTTAISANSAGLTGATANLTVSSLPGGSGQSLFTVQTPVNDNLTDGVPYELGMKFRVTRAGQIAAIRYWKSSNDTGTHVGRIWSANGTLLASTTFTSESASGWQEQALSSPLSIQANTTYVVSVNIGGYYPYTASGLATSIVNGDIQSIADGNNGVFGAAGTFPSGSYNNSNYFRDIIFVPDTTSVIQKLGGDNQGGAANTVLPTPLTVQVKDANGNALPNTTVTFAVTTGNGSVSPTSATTNASGQASATLTLGASGATEVTATASGIGSVVFRGVVGNAVYLENLQPGTSTWRVTNWVTQTAPEIVGYAGAVSVNRGGSLPVKVSVRLGGSYNVDVYRLGYYAGTGGRLMASLTGLSGIAQPPCNVTDPATKLIECNWPTSFTLNIGANWTSGLYIANLTDAASGKQSQVWFVVRDDASTSDIVFQSAFTTYLAYNNYGDAERHSLYAFNSTNGQLAQKVSFDRPLGHVTIDPQRYDKITIYEHNMVRWLESQGYDVTYTTNMETHGSPASLQNHKVFLTAGHDEYWSLEMRNGVEQARDTGTNLAFFVGNSAYWRVRFEPSTSGTPNRVMACYKDPVSTPDPVAPTYLWRGPENNRPENALLGVMYVGDSVFNQWGGADFITKNTNDPFYANTGLVDGTHFTGLVGYEWDAIVDNGFTPPGLVVLGESAPVALGVGTLLPPNYNASVSHAVRYTAASGAKVFTTGSIQWMWGLDSDGVSPARTDLRLKQFAVNVLGNMGAKPLTPDDGLVVP